MFLKKIENNELYLYMDGHLIYKRWLDTGQSKVFDVMAFDKYTTTSIRELEFENSGNGIICIPAIFKMYPTAQSGRKTGIISGYRPNHVFEYGENGKLIQTYIGDIVFEDATVEPGEEKTVTIRFIMNQPIEKYLTKGNKWWIHEGPRAIGEAIVM